MSGTPAGGARAAAVPVRTAAAMRDLGRRLAPLLRAGDLVILSGPLGAGKTTLTQGIGDGLGVRGPVTSPTFVIARVHPPLRPPGEHGPGGGGGRGIALVHADAYRLGGAPELDDLDLDADMATSVTVVEWGEGLAEELAADRLEIRITPAAPGPGPDGEGEGDGAADAPRSVSITGVGPRWRDVRLPPAADADRL